MGEGWPRISTTTGHALARQPGMSVFNMATLVARCASAGQASNGSPSLQETGTCSGNNQGFSRIMTRPAGRVKGVLKSRGSGRVGSGHYGLKSHGSGWVGSRGFQNLACRVGSDQEVFKISRVGSGHDPRDTGHSAGQAIMTRELFWADPRVKPADLAGGSAFFKLTAESHVDAVQASRGSGPRVRQ